ncbi:hypothetical protein ABZW11_18180 [Nonomuraea sp. NPDC004580]|uniref:hypothetical protein n=1 Tax=Nonomuraea sp. NPDC004580 TaxID=3154552 RepID=UPI0033AFDB61
MVFQRFARLDACYKDVGGTGLSLAIARQIAEGGGAETGGAETGARGPVRECAGSRTSPHR